jgi:hypothetical protein
MGKKIYTSGKDNIHLLSNKELRECNYFCIHCFSSWGYYRIRTTDFFCRRCGKSTTVQAFKDKIESIIKGREDMKKSLPRSGDKVLIF